MTFGTQVRVFCAALAVVFGNVARAHDQEGFRALMAEFSTVVNSRVAYAEVKSLSILESTVEQSGVLSYSAPATIVREVRDPVIETYAIVGTTMRVIKEDEEQGVDLDEVPLLRVFIESFRATLAGDVERLDEHYHIDYTSDGSFWSMSLRPRSRQLAGFIETILFKGRGAQIEEIEVSETNGDWSHMSLTPLEDMEIGDAP